MASIAQLRPSRAAVGGPGAGARAGSASALASNDALVLRNVTRQFGALRAVDGVSLSVAAGEKYAILGSNGAGKTTLFNTITGDFPPTAGRIHFFGEDITELPPHERIRKGLRRTYQSSLLFRDLTVRDNLFLAVRGVASGPPTVTAPVPADACFLFGPEVSSAELRPRDPDVTGGFYQPMRVSVAGAETTAFGLLRIRCNLGSAGAEAVALPREDGGVSALGSSCP